MGRPLGSKNKKNTKNSTEKPIKNKTKKLANTTAESVSNTTTVAPSTSGYSLRLYIELIAVVDNQNQMKLMPNEF